MAKVLDAQVKSPQDTGYDELRNSGKVPILLHPGVRIGQIAFFKIQPTHIPYEKGYSYSLGVSGSRFFKDLEYKWIGELAKLEKQEGDKKELVINY